MLKYSSLLSSFPVKIDFPLFKLSIKLSGNKVLFFPNVLIIKKALLPKTGPWPFAWNTPVWLIFKSNLLGGILYIFDKVNMKVPGAIFPHPLFSQEIEAYPPKIFPLSFLYKHKVGPWLSHFLWNASAVAPSLVALYIKSSFLFPHHSYILFKNSTALFDSFNILLSTLISLVLNFKISDQFPINSLLKQLIRIWYEVLLFKLDIL